MDRMVIRLSSTLLQPRQRQATNDRDAIYSVLGFSRGVENVAPLPSHCNDATTTFARSSWIIMQRPGQTDLLLLATRGNRTSKAASWMRDWAHLSKRLPHWMLFGCSRRQPGSPSQRDFYRQVKRDFDYFCACGRTRHGDARQLKRRTFGFTMILSSQLPA